MIRKVSLALGLTLSLASFNSFAIGSGWDDGGKGDQGRIEPLKGEQLEPIEQVEPLKGEQVEPIQQDQQPIDQQPLDHHEPQGTAELTWDELKTSCVDPSQFHSQNPPTDIKVNCSDYKRTWVPDGNDLLNLGEQRNVSFAVTSDKYHISSSSAPKATNGIDFGCPRFREVERTYSIERSLTCDELLAYKGNLEEFCMETLETALLQNPKLINEVDTGVVVDSCTLSDAGHKKH